MPIHALTIRLVSQQLARCLAHGGADLVRVEELPAGLHIRYTIHATAGPHVETIAALASARVEVWDTHGAAWRHLHSLLPGCMDTRPTCDWPCDERGEIDLGAEGERYDQFEADHKELRRVAHSILGGGD